MSSRAQVEVGRGGDFPKTTLKKGSHQTSLRPRSDRGRRCEVYFTGPFGDDDALTSHWSINSRRVGRFSHHARQCENFSCGYCKEMKRKHHEIAGPSDNFRIRKSDHPNKRMRNTAMCILLPTELVRRISEFVVQLTHARYVQSLSSLGLDNLRFKILRSRDEE